MKLGPGVSGCKVNRFVSSTLDNETVVVRCSLLASVSIYFLYSYTMYYINKYTSETK